MIQRITYKSNPNTSKAIVDYTSPALCTPVTPFSPIGDAACRQHAGGGPSHEHRQHAQNSVKMARVVPEISSRRDRHTDRHRGLFITVLRNRSHGRSRHNLLQETAFAYYVVLSSCS